MTSQVTLPPAQETRVTLPRTSPQTYVSDMSALNLRYPDEGGDWHYRVYWYVLQNEFDASMAGVRLAGEGCATNTNPVLGALGIRDVTQLLTKSLGFTLPPDRTPVFAANHARAVADIVCRQTLARGRPLTTSAEIVAWLGPHAIDDLKQNYLLPLRGLFDDQKRQAFDSWLTTISPHSRRRTGATKM